jgi:Na+-transporting methylmalonyl-CoA/oxaloacetate decarboxylase beta subunit
MFSEDSSLGIIGGADGPTAIVVSGSGWGLVLELLAVVLVLVVIVTAGVLLIRRIRKRKK